MLFRDHGGGHVLKDLELFLFIVLYPVVVIELRDELLHSQVEP